MATLGYPVFRYKATTVDTISCNYYYTLTVAELGIE